MASLYDRLGGEKGIDAIVTTFQKYMLSDPITAPYFSKTDMVVQAKREKQFVAMVTGGPQNYEGRSMKESHKDMKISQKEFDATWDNFEKALKDNNIGANKLEK